jgi:hypothetical protein
MNTFNKIVLTVSLITCATISFDAHARFGLRTPLMRLFNAQPKRFCSTAPLQETVASSADKQAATLVTLNEKALKEIGSLKFQRKILAAWAIGATGVATAYHCVADKTPLSKIKELYAQKKDAAKAFYVAQKTKLKTAVIEFFADETPKASAIQPEKTKDASVTHQESPQEVKPVTTETTPTQATPAVAQQQN